MRDEPVEFFRMMFGKNMPIEGFIDSDWTMANARLCDFYGLPEPKMGSFERISLRPEDHRGGLLTMGAVLGLTSDGTRHRPVHRGVWLSEAIFGKTPPPPPANVPAIEPNPPKSAKATLRDKLEAHRNDANCAACHAKIDPPGFALEGFDVMGGLRSRYRAMGEGAPEVGLGRGGQKFAFHLALPVDSTGEMPDGRTFEDVRQFKRRLLEDERVIARNLVRQFIVFATGAPVRFNDRAAVERILDQAKAGGYGVRSLLHGVIQSDLFLQK
jgi:hypothetical protein